ncbi:hypothetical protein AB0A63_08040 [Lentzea sp. NPDC042327]|uniref:hypothetical protein n=1 Tax=Lentzea sp. NPDC042327 TaxID=3154801 RepID=UPI0033CF3C95
MDFWKTIKVLLRRWYVALPVLLLSLGGAGVVFASVPPEYESTGTDLLTVPKAGATLDPSKPSGIINPLLAFDASLTTTAQLLTQVLLDPAVYAQLTRNNPDIECEAGDGGLRGPFVQVVCKAPTPEAARATVDGAFKRLSQELVERQRKLGAPESTFINVETVVAPTEATLLVGGKLRAAGAALALGLAASLTSAYMIESFMLRRKKPEARKPEPRKPDDPKWPSDEGERRATPAAPQHHKLSNEANPTVRIARPG